MKHKMFGGNISDIKEIRDNRRYRRQRAERGWAICDLWDMSSWFAETLAPMLREAEANLVSYPDEITEDEWRSVLLEMAELLEVADAGDDSVARRKAGIEPDDYSQEAYTLIEAEQNKAKDRFFFLFNKWFYHLGI